MNTEHQPIKQQRFHRYLLLLAIFLIVPVAAYSGILRSNAVGQDALRRPLDPLSEAEYLRGLEQLEAITDEGEQVNAAAAERQVVLLFERYHTPKADSSAQSATDSATDSTARRGEGYIYNYDTDTLQRAIVLLDKSGETVGEPQIIETVQDVQLPLIPLEEKRALAILQSDEEAWQTIREQFKRITGGALTDIAQLNTKVIIFRADAMPDRVNEASSKCGIHRCAQVLLFTDKQVAFELSPIVDLSTETITQLNWQPSIP